MSQAAFMAIQGLWSGPWLRDVAGLEREMVAQVLFMIAAAMVTGFILMGAAAERLSRLGIKPIAIARTAATTRARISRPCIFTNGTRNISTLNYCSRVGDVKT